MPRTFFEDFALDDGRKVIVEWGWDGLDEGVIVESIWDESSSGSEDEITMNGNEAERFDKQVLALDPFPPWEPYEP